MEEQNDVHKANVERISPGLALTLAQETPEDPSAETKLLTIILRYTGDFTHITEETGFTGIPLLNGFAVGRAPYVQIRFLSWHPQILYIDETRQMEYAQAVSPASRTDACFPIVDQADLILDGQGILVGVIDTGIDYFHPAFIRPDGRSRLYAYWDQNTDGTPPDIYGFGSVLTQEEINQAISGARRSGYPDANGHGTAVASIISALAPGSILIGVACQPDSAAVLCGIDFAVRLALQAQTPLVLNLSYGNNYGEHHGNAWMETYLSELRRLGKITVVTGTGNEGASGRHKQFDPRTEPEIRFITGAGLSAGSLQLWSESDSAYRFSVLSPDGTRSPEIDSSMYGSSFSFFLGGTEISAQIGLPSPYNTKQEIYIRFQGTPVTPGSWALVFSTNTTRALRIDAWFPVEAATNSALYFETPTTTLTLTIPSTAEHVITVGAYNPRLQTVPVFSGSGGDGLIKPDLIAPGVSITVANAGGGYRMASGTSFAVPFVSAASAGMMQWGIVNGNDPFLYADRVRAYLRNGARAFPGAAVPNPRSGYGRLCADDSLPRI